MHDLIDSRKIVAFGMDAAIEYMKFYNSVADGAKHAKSVSLLSDFTSAIKQSGVSRDTFPILVYWNMNAMPTAKANVPAH